MFVQIKRGTYRYGVCNDDNPPSIASECARLSGEQVGRALGVTSPRYIQPRQKVESDIDVAVPGYYWIIKVPPKIVVGSGVPSCSVGVTAMPPTAYNPHPGFSRRLRILAIPSGSSGSIGVWIQLLRLPSQWVGEAVRDGKSPNAQDHRESHPRATGALLHLVACADWLGQGPSVLVRQVGEPDGEPGR